MFKRLEVQKRRREGAHEGEEEGLKVQNGLVMDWMLLLNAEVMVR